MELEFWGEPNITYTVRKLRSLFDPRLKLTPHYTLTKDGKLRSNDFAPLLYHKGVDETVEAIHAQLALLVHSGRLTQRQIQKAKIYSVHTFDNC